MPRVATKPRLKSTIKKRNPQFGVCLGFTPATSPIWCTLGFDCSCLPHLVHAWVSLQLPQAWHGGHRPDVRALGLQQGQGCKAPRTYGVAWCGVVWCGVAWCGVVLCGVVWCGTIGYGPLWYGGQRQGRKTPCMPYLGRRMLEYPTTCCLCRRQRLFPGSCSRGDNCLLQVQ